MSSTPDGRAPHNTSPPGDVQNDDDLRQRFAAERAQEGETVPALARILSPRTAVTGRRRLQPRFALGALAILVIAVGVWGRPGSTAPHSAALSVLVPGQLRVPTDFLLDISSGTSVRAGEVPSIGAIDWYPLDQQENMR